MKHTILLTFAALLTLSACGIKRPLIAPKDIPAHEERLRKKRERLEDAPQAAPLPTVTTPTEN